MQLCTDLTHQHTSIFLLNTNIVVWQCKHCNCIRSSWYLLWHHILEFLRAMETWLIVSWCSFPHEYWSVRPSFTYPKQNFAINNQSQYPQFTHHKFISLLSVNFHNFHMVEGVLRWGELTTVPLSSSWPGISLFWSALYLYFPPTQDLAHVSADLMEYCCNEWRERRGTCPVALFQRPTFNAQMCTWSQSQEPCLQWWASAQMLLWRGLRSQLGDIACQWREYSPVYTSTLNKFQSGFKSV